MSESVYFTTLGLLFGTILIIFGMKYLSAIWQARSRVLSEDAYRALAEKAVAAQTQIAPSLSAIQAELGALKASLAAVEKVLKAVE
jgi:hypothetical protein